VSKPELDSKCFVCGRALTSVTFIADENLTVHESDPAAGRILASKRIFRGHCPDHGEQTFHIGRFGNHSTRLARDMRDAFPDALRPAVMERLTPEDRECFYLAIKGKRHYEPHEYARWLGALRAVQAQATPER
jgi:hypothetical protein